MNLFLANGITSHLIVDGLGQPLAVTSTGAAGDKRKEVMPLIKKMSGRLNPLIFLGTTPILEADKGYDSEALRLQILSLKIFPYIPYRRMGKIKSETSTKVLKKHRWKVERGIAWLQRKYRRLAVRWERRMKYWEGFLTLGISKEVYYIRHDIITLKEGCSWF